jgi:hypothetical protein
LALELALFPSASRLNNSIHHPFADPAELRQFQKAPHSEGFTRTAMWTHLRTTTTITTY